MYMDSSDLELPNDGGLQVIGLRYQNVQIPKNATITKAYVEFTQDEVTSAAVVNLIIDGDLTPDAPPFTSADRDVSSRPRTIANVPWSPEEWPTTGDKYRTSDISSVIAEIVAQDGWAAGNALAIIISDDPVTPSVGNRTAESGAGPVSPLLHVEYTSLFAYNPDPADGSVYEDTWASLSWLPGETAATHDVYFSDNSDDVLNGTGDAFRVNQASTFYIVGFPGYPFPDGLIPGTTYYWRIDEVEADGSTKYTGDVWSFTVPSKTAYAPDPADGAEFVAVDAELSWTPGFGAKLHTVYIGTDYDTVDNAAGGMPLGVTKYKPAAPLESEKVYYWRVDEFDAAATYKGDIWGFTTPGAAGSPSPSNGAGDVQMTDTLSWIGATNAVSHDVYFGTDKEAVRNATTGSPEFKGNKALGSESLDAGKLGWQSDYYWRVDAVYNSGPVKGLVWGFTTADFILVDGFETYNDIDPPDPASNRIFESWIDGFGTTDNGALVGNDMPPYAEQTIVHGGAQSMPYFYDNNLKTSEATLTLTYPKDWTEEGVTKLSLWFRGDKGNAADKMYVALNGNAAVYHDDSAATQKAGWNEWIIDLQAFADQGVNLANVNTITIGVGTKGSPAAGGSGQMYFDDIALYR